METKPRILHPTDFSETSDRALRIAIDYARLHAAPLELVHVERSIATAMHSGATPKAAHGETYVEHSLGERALRVREAGVECETFAILGSPGSAILDHAREHHVTLIAMGTHGRTGIGRALVGSVAQRAARYSDCPVLVVAPK